MPSPKEQPVSLENMSSLEKSLPVTQPQDAVSAQQRTAARALKRRQAAAQSSAAGRSLSHSAGARLYDQLAEEEGEDTDDSAKSMEDSKLTNGTLSHSAAEETPRCCAV